MIISKNKFVSKAFVFFLIISILFGCNNIPDEVDTIDSIKMNMKSERIADLVNLDHTSEKNCLKEANDTLYKEFHEKNRGFIENPH